MSIPSESIAIGNLVFRSETGVGSKSQQTVYSPKCSRCGSDRIGLHVRIGGATFYANRIDASGMKECPIEISCENCHCGIFISLEENHIRA